MNGFDANEHLNMLCKEHSVTMSEDVKVIYQKGWSELMTSLVFQLKDYPIRLIDVDDSHAQLDIKFQMLKKRHEVIVWRILEDFKDQSRVICMGCGRKSNNLKTVVLNLRYCSECFQSAAKNGKTGTWLDKY